MIVGSEVRVVEVMSLPSEEGVAELLDELLDAARDEEPVAA